MANNDVSHKHRRKCNIDRNERVKNRPGLCVKKKREKALTEAWRSGVIPSSPTHPCGSRVRACDLFPFSSGSHSHCCLLPRSRSAIYFCLNSSVLPPQSLPLCGDGRTSAQHRAERSDLFPAPSTVQRSPLGCPSPSAHRRGILRQSGT